jgi:hypothetical protein
VNALKKLLGGASVLLIGILISVAIMAAVGGVALFFLRITPH